jgi:hypothetical protein
MRLWSLHPKYLDQKGLVALWREALLAQAVLSARTRGYQKHPQLARFRESSDPQQAIVSYLRHVREEANRRGYRFDETKIGPGDSTFELEVTDGQLEYERSHLLAKLAKREPSLRAQLESVKVPDSHPLFRVVSGGIAPWEVIAR